MLTPPEVIEKFHLQSCLQDPRLQGRAPGFRGGGGVAGYGRDRDKKGTRQGLNRDRLKKV